MKQLTQRDLCVLFLSERMGWVRVVEMRGKPFHGDFIGSEADKRMYEVMKIIEQDGFYQVNGMRYVVEAGREGKFKMYQVVSSKPRPIAVYVPNGRGGMTETWPNGRP